MAHYPHRSTVKLLSTSHLLHLSLSPAVRSTLQSSSPSDSCPPLPFILHRILPIILHKSKCCDYSILYIKNVGLRELVYLAQGCSMFLLVFLGLKSSSVIAFSIQSNFPPHSTQLETILINLLLWKNFLEKLCIHVWGNVEVSLREW